MKKCKIFNIKTKNYQGIISSAIWSINSDGILINCLFDSNYASTSNCGSIIYILLGNILFQKCGFKNNKVTSYESIYGGACNIEKSNFSMIDCIFENNYAGTKSKLFTNTLKIIKYKCKN